MESKEKIEALNYTWFYDPTCQEEADKRETIIKELKKDLEELEELKKIMGTPIQDIMKRLKILEIIKPYMKISSDGIISCHDLILIPFCESYEKQYNDLKEWLDNGKD